MSKVNFVSEFNSFMRYARDSSLSLRERMLWIALFYVANDRATYNEQTQEYDWPDDFIQVSNGELNLYCCLDKRAIETLRNNLKQRGLIDFQAGQKNKRNPAYKLLYLSTDVGYKKVPNPPPNNAPNDVPNHAPNYAPNHVPNDAPRYTPSHAENPPVLGANLYPTMPPYSKYKYTNQEIGGNESRTGTGAEQTRYPNAGNFQHQPSQGFVDLGAAAPACEGFVPLPWEEGQR